MTLTIFSIIGHVLSIVFVIIAITTINQLRLVIQDKNERIDWQKEYINKLKETNEMAVKLAQDCVKDRKQLYDAVMYAAHFLKPRKKLRMYRIANGKDHCSISTHLSTLWHDICSIPVNVKPL